VSDLEILYLEPFDGGSHAVFTQTLTTHVPAKWTVLTLPGRHWKWRMRGAAPYWVLAHREALARSYDVVFASSMVPLAELVGLAPHLASVPKILYFHENQLTYPVRDAFFGERDHHYGFSQLVSALAADACWFNSAYNRDGFLDAGRVLLRRMPDFVPKDWVDSIAARSHVYPVPMILPEGFEGIEDAGPRTDGPIILWNHRWEHDKRPDRFFDALDALDRRGIAFRLVLLGQRYRTWPAAFDDARARYGHRVLQFGPAASRADYRAWLTRAHIAVSTADQEFFGISMLEATHFGAYPLVPDRLAYPEFYPPEYRYGSFDELVERIGSLCCRWIEGTASLRGDRRAITRPLSDPLLETYAFALRELASPGHAQHGSVSPR